jgi:hypothetical protein
MGPSGIENEHGWTFTTIVAEADGTVVLRGTATREAVPCPTRGVVSRRQHSWYTRRAMDRCRRGVAWFKPASGNVMGHRLLSVTQPGPGVDREAGAPKGIGSR